jgi:hypothetical protein
MLVDVTTCSAFQAAEQRSSASLTVVAAEKAAPDTAAEPPFFFSVDQTVAGRWTILEVEAVIYL